MVLFDTHAHFDDEKFAGVRDDLIKEALTSGVGYIINASSDLASSRRSIALADEYPQFFACIGIHPEEAGKDGKLDDVMDELRRLYSESGSKVVAVGEIGLDYYWEDNPPKEVQKEWMRAQFSLARELALPVVIHDRDAHGDSFDIACEFPDVIGVFHSYSGSVEMARELIKRGWYISFSGVLTFKNAAKSVECARELPLERLLVETDCPYLAPVPMRGKLNHSAYVRYTLERLAEIRSISVEEAADATVSNAKRLFGIK